MADPSLTPGSSGSSAVRSDRASTPGPPRWVKAFGFAALTVVVVVVILHLTGNSLGGPGLHTP